MILELETLCPARGVADRIAAHLLDARLIACANRSRTVVSLFRWDGEVKAEEEYSLRVKTRVELGDRVEAAILQWHPYELPAVLRHEVQANAAYEAWVLAETLGA
ncbi:divalent-cation tolerance protein CutA [Oceanicola sp. S124]|uniref:divalent-cation tolerance protein CutA n=1 Tax=Oceanicola sp. S124 TaxID=1042378 RepID=UPI00025579E4|nr:divalent-cation tolerance protein CutA [Oceanicola sp. S124]